MELKYYQQRAYKALGEHDDAKDRANNWCLGLSGEVGEVEELIKHHYYGGEKLNKVKLAKELGDVLWYINALASHFGLSMNMIATMNIAKLDHRHSDGVFSSEGSLNRHMKETEFKETDIYRTILLGLEKSPVEESIRNGGYHHGE